MRLLLAEDDPRLGRVVAEGLRESGFDVDWAQQGPAALDLALHVGYDGVVLDILLPALDGWEICRQMRRNDVSTPILVLTARDQLEDKLRDTDWSTVLRTIAFPLARHPWLAGAMLVFTMALIDTGVPLLFHNPTCATLVFTRRAAGSDLGGALLMALPMLALAAGAATLAGPRLQAALTERMDAAASKGIPLSWF